MRPRFAFVVGMIGVVVCDLSNICVAEVKLPAVFANNMVLQRNHQNPVWGKADPGEKIVVAIAGQTTTATTDKNGRWHTTLPTLPLQPQPIEMRVRGSFGSEVVLSNVLVGDVWLCTGPSNIYWPVKRCDHAKQEIAAAKFTDIRFFTVTKQTADTPQEDCRGHWFECSPRTVGDVSGIGYFFSRRLHQDLDVPIGMLQSFWGGSRVEAWTSQEALDAQPALQPILHWWESQRKAFDSGILQTSYQRELRQWKGKAAIAKAAGGEIPRKPKPPEDPRGSRHRPACLYNGMIAPLIPYGLRGIISYQGLGNLFWAKYSRVLMPTMIRDWRSRWNRKTLPFGMVQPAPYPCHRWRKQDQDAYALQRESQLLVLDELPNTGIAPTMDIGDLKELHFTNKQDVARRLAAWALATVYKQTIPFAGPMYESMNIEDDKIRIHFQPAGQQLSTSDKRPPTEFTIAGADKNFFPARVIIDGHTVVVHCKQVPRPVAVRFAWSDTAVPNLVNSAGLPASIFRTDVPPLDKNE